MLLEGKLRRHRLNFDDFTERQGFDRGICSRIPRFIVREAREQVRGIHALELSKHC